MSIVGYGCNSFFEGIGVNYGISVIECLCYGYCYVWVVVLDRCVWCGY